MWSAGSWALVTLASAFGFAMVLAVLLDFIHKRLIHRAAERALLRAEARKWASDDEAVLQMQGRRNDRIYARLGASESPEKRAIATDVVNLVNDCDTQTAKHREKLVTVGAEVKS